MKEITVKTFAELKEAFKDEERNLTIVFKNNRITKFPKMNIERDKGVVILKLYTPKLTTLKNVPMPSRFMNWLDVEEASLTKLENASECNITNPCVCYLPCLKFDSITVTKENTCQSGFIRLALAWQQFMRNDVQNIFNVFSTTIVPRACVPEMVCNNVDDLNLPEVLRDVVKSTDMLTTVEINLARKVMETEIGNLTFSSI